MRRMMLYDRLGNPLGELAEADVFEATLREEINGEHSLTITTTRVLEKGIRMLYKDGRSKWREFVVAGVDAEHASGNRAIGTYYCVWSVQQDLQGVTVSVMPGVQSPVSAGTALGALLSTTERWARGTVTQMTTGGASMYDRSAWEALSVLVSVWGGEIDAAINVGTQSGVTSREVDLYAVQGNQTAMRRFDFGADLISVKRTLADDPLFCRISPRGKGEQTDAGGYGRKITIESVNDGKDWLEYAPMVDAAKLPDGNGGYEYPTLIVENSDCETPTDLKSWAQGVLAQYCTPKVTYEVDVVQAGVEGVDVTGVSLGDAVQVVDRKFGGDGVRVQGRVRSITTDLLNERDITIVIGDAEESISQKFSNVGKALATVGNDLTVMSTAEYIDNLLERINTEVNATGGYTYIVPGNGILTFDVAVADPLNPVEASQVVEVKGGSIRIANSKTAQGAWQWKTVFTSGHIAANLVTAANLTAGYISNASGSYWDLDNDVLQIASTATLDGNAVSDVLDSLDDAAKVATNYLTYNSTNGLDVGYSGTSAKTRVNGSGVEVFDNSGVSAAFFGTSGGFSIARIGRTSGSGNVLMSSEGYVDLRNATTTMAHFGYGSALDEDGNISAAPYFDLGIRKSSTRCGKYSFAGGYLTTASNYCAMALGQKTTASGRGSFAVGVGLATPVTEDGPIASGNGAVAFGLGKNYASGLVSFAGGAPYIFGDEVYQRTQATQTASFAFGMGAQALMYCGVAFGMGTKTSSSSYTESPQFVCGRWNSPSSSDIFEIGNGSFNGSAIRSNAFHVTAGGYVYAGTTQISSDMRIKTDLGELDRDEAADFVRNLKPRLFEKLGHEELGFFAQEVEENGEYGGRLVSQTENYGYDDFRNLDYQGIIAPLVAYAQSLESRIAELEKRIEELEKGRR